MGCGIFQLDKRLHPMVHAMRLAKVSRETVQFSCFWLLNTCWDEWRSSGKVRKMIPLAPESYWKCAKKSGVDYIKRLHQRPPAVQWLRRTTPKGRSSVFNECKLAEVGWQLMNKFSVGCWEGRFARQFQWIDDADIVCFLTFNVR